MSIQNWQHLDIQQLIERFAAKDAEAALDRERDRLIVDARDSDVDDGDIAMLVDFEHLVDLNLAASKVTNVSIEHIVSFAKLEYLDLGRTAVLARLIWFHRVALGLQSSKAPFSLQNEYLSSSLVRTPDRFPPYPAAH